MFVNVNVMSFLTRLMAVSLESPAEFVTLNTSQFVPSPKSEITKTIDTSQKAADSNNWISFTDLAKQELIPSVKSPNGIKKVVGNYLKLLHDEFNAASNFLYNPGQIILAKRKKQLKKLMGERRFPVHGIGLLKKYQQNLSAGKNHEVTRDEIWQMIGESSITEFGYPIGRGYPDLTIV